MLEDLLGGNAKDVKVYRHLKDSNSSSNRFLREGFNITFLSKRSRGEFNDSNIPKSVVSLIIKLIIFVY